MVDKNKKLHECEVGGATPDLRGMTVDDNGKPVTKFFKQSYMYGSKNGDLKEFFIAIPYITKRIFLSVLKLNIISISLFAVAIFFIKNEKTLLLAAIALSLIVFCTMVTATTWLTTIFIQRFFLKKTHEEYMAIVTRIKSKELEFIGKGYQFILLLIYIVAFALCVLAAYQIISNLKF